MNLRYLSFFLILILSCSKKRTTIKDTSFKGEIEVVKTLGGSKNEAAKSVIATQDGGYIVAGYTQSNNGDIIDKSTEGYDFWIIKFNEDNSIEWQKTLGGSSSEKANDIIQTSDGGFAVLGYSESNDGDVSANAGSKDFWIVKLTTTGEIIWQKSFGYLGSDFGTSLIQSEDNGFLIIGELDVSASNGQGNSKMKAKHAGGDFWAIKLTQNGSKEWSKFFGGTFTDTPNGVIETADNGFILIGGSDSNDVDITNNKGTYDFWVLKIDNLGAIIWQKSFGGNQIDEARGIVKSDDGNFIIAGDTRSSNADITNQKGGADIWIIKINSEGSLLWQKNYGGSDFDVARSINKTNDNAFLISGSSRSSNGDVLKNNGQNDLWVLKIDTNGELLWQKSIGGSEIDFAYDAVELTNNTIVAVGESSSNNIDIIENKGFTDLLIVKIK